MRLMCVPPIGCQRRIGCLKFVCISIDTAHRSPRTHARRTDSLARAGRGTLTPACDTPRAKNAGVGCAGTPRTHTAQQVDCPLYGAPHKGAFQEAASRRANLGSVQGCFPQAAARPATRCGAAAAGAHPISESRCAKLLCGTSALERRVFSHITSPFYEYLLSDGGAA